MTESHFRGNPESNRANLLPKWLVSRRGSAGLKSAEWFVMLTETKLKQRREQRGSEVTKQEISPTSDLQCVFLPHDKHTLLINTQQV